MARKNTFIFNNKLSCTISFKGKTITLHFPVEKDKQLLKIIILATALIPLYNIYLVIFPKAIQVSIFITVYSFFILVIWILYYYDFFSKDRLQRKTDRNYKISTNDETPS